MSHLNRHNNLNSVRNNRRASKRYPWLVLSVTSIGVMLTLLNVGTLNVALPDIANHFHAGSTSASWILLSYMLANTILILVFGRMADIFGRKKMYLAGFILFTGVSLLIGISPNVAVLIILRMFQAAGGAMIITNTTALLTDSFPEPLLSRGLGINVLVSSVAQLVGPVLGGWIAFQLGWRWVFWFNVPLGVIGVVWAAFTLHEGTKPEKRETIDWVGSGLIFIVLAGLILALSEGGVLGWLSPIVMLGAAVFVIGLPIFVVQQQHSPAPVVDLQLLRSRNISLSYIAALFNNMVRTSVVLLIALFFESTSGLNPFAAGLRVLPVTIGMMLMSPIAGSLAARFTYRLLSAVGLAVTIIGLALLAGFLGGGHALLLSLVAMFLVGAGAGLFMTPNTTFIMTSVPTERRGIANGLRSMLQNMGQVIGTALSLALVTSGLPTRLKNAVYAGRMAHVSHTDIQLLTTGFHWALTALLAASVAGIVAALLRTKGRQWDI
ncbi:MFS transporter [Alicyclobacillus sp. SO9]|uniref:MFS transporter n=1 Tax=Alicyclobacillus sp. SO9 TaxID=2665646 RepID=UPI0018E72E96|nr:MFS transporter [Alicyclobacillus sp. SO9]QQE79885.1 MFS transporter [Alicyclobacillus sp. SO9]